MTNFYGKVNLLNHLSKTNVGTLPYIILKEDDEDFEESATKFFRENEGSKFILRSGNTLEGALQGKSCAGLFDSFGMRDIDELNNLRRRISLPFYLAGGNGETKKEYVNSFFEGNQNWFDNWKSTLNVSSFDDLLDLELNLNQENFLLKEIQKARELRRYSSLREIDLSTGEMQYILQVKEDDSFLTHMMVHPNNPNLFHIETLDRSNSNVINGIPQGELFESNSENSFLISQYLEAVKDLDSNISYIAEIVNHSFVQLTPGFKKGVYIDEKQKLSNIICQVNSFDNLDLDSFYECNSNTSRYDLGNELNYTNLSVFNFREHYRLLQHELFRHVEQSPLITSLDRDFFDLFYN